MPAKNLQRVAEGGTYCHVYNRGVESRNIFADDVDYQVFLDYLKDYLSAPKAPESTKKDFTISGRVYRGVPHQPKNYFKKVELLAYSLKPNHFHLLLALKNPKSLQAFIRSLLTRYSMYFNKKYNRTGTLFAGPYKSVKIMHESGLLLLTHYFHNEGGASSYSEYLGQRDTPWVRTKIVLSIKTSVGSYKNYVEKYVLSEGEKDHLEHISIESPKHGLERKNLESVRLKPWHRIPELAAAGSVFVLLLGLGVRNISSAPNSPQASPVTLGTQTSLASPTPSPSPVPETATKMLTVRYDGGPVNIREKPTTQSQKIGEAKDGDKFEFISENSLWYQVNLPDGSTGFINSQYIEKQERGE